jgi:hypothetical protein
VFDGSFLLWQTKRVLLVHRGPTGSVPWTDVGYLHLGAFEVSFNGEVSVEEFSDQPKTQPLFLLSTPIYNGVCI